MIPMLRHAPARLIAGRDHVYRSTLANGLPVIVAPQRGLHTAHLALFVRAGSRYETAKTNGLSHLLEHAIHRGTDRLVGAHAVALAFEELGGSLVATTAIDQSEYAVTAPPESINTISSHLSEITSRPVWHDLAIEKEIVLNELDEGLDEDGRVVDADIIARQAIYGDHPLGLPIGGTHERVGSFNAASLANWHHRFYTAANAALVFSGAVDVVTAMRLAERDFGALPRGERVTTSPPLLDQTRPRLVVVEDSGSQADIRVCLRALHPASPTTDVLMSVIDGGMSSRLYHRVVDEGGQAYDVEGTFHGFVDEGFVSIASAMRPERAPRIVGEILRMISELAREGPSLEEIGRAHRAFRWSMEAARDASSRTAEWYGRAALLDWKIGLRDYVAAIERVTADDVREVAREMAQPDRLNVVVVGDLDSRTQAQLDVVEKWKGWRSS